MFFKGIQKLLDTHVIMCQGVFRKPFDVFYKNWSHYPGAVDVWKRNYKHVEQLFDYGSAVRKVMYTTNAIEAINSSFRKVTKKGAFPNENVLFKLLYLRCKELLNIYLKRRKIVKRWWNIFLGKSPFLLRE